MPEYFRGWYVKLQGAEESVAVIPALHRSRGEPAWASVQIIAGGRSRFLRLGEAKMCDWPEIALPGCRLTPRLLELNLPEISGRVRFFARRAPRGDVMGPLRFLPECRHSVYSLAALACGELDIGGERHVFSASPAYVEGDRGKSFPHSYVWTQCLFPRGSVMMARAELPLFGRSFTGALCCLLLDGREYRLASYLGARSELRGRVLTVRQGNLELSAELGEGETELRAPDGSGGMERRVGECLEGEASYRLSRSGRVLFEYESRRASFELEKS